MQSDVEDLGPPRSGPWFVASRVQEFEGEQRANRLRVVGIGAFYAIELLNRYGVRLGFIEIPPLADVDQRFHVAVTWLAVAWIALALGVELCLRNRLFPPALKFASTAGDIVFLTSILCVADGPRSPLVVGYFLVIAGSSLRLSLRLVQCATVGTIAGYLYLSGFARWFTSRDLRVPRYHQLRVLLALGLLGIILGQVIRNARRMAKQYAENAGSNEGAGQG